MAPRKGRRHVLRVIREILFFEPQRHGTDLPGALHFVSRMLPHKSVVVVLSDFLEARAPVRFGSRSGSVAPLPAAEPLAPTTQVALRQAHRRHDLVAVQITDRYELELPALGRLVLKDAETGEVVEVQTGNARQRAAFAEMLRVLTPGGTLFVHEINTRNLLFRFYMGYVFPSLNCIDEGVERWLLAHRLDQYTAAPLVDVRYFTFLPDFVPAVVVRWFAPVERWLEQSGGRVYSAHYMAVLRKPASYALGAR